MMTRAMRRAATVFLCAIALAFGCAIAIAFAADLPLNPAVTPDTLKTTACVPNWTSTVRPTTSVTNRVKRQLMDAQGIPWTRASEFELDHHIPLVLGGNPSDPRNLWLQSWTPDAPAGYQGETDAHAKDHLEVALHKLVCSGQLPLAEAQTCIFDDWRACARAHLKGPTK